MKHPALFDIEPDTESQASKLSRFCAENKIWVLNAKGAEEPWLAMAWSAAAERTGLPCDGTEDDCFELYAGYCSLLTDLGLMVTGTSKLDVCRQIAKNLKLTPPA